MFHLGLLELLVVLSIVILLFDSQKAKQIGSFFREISQKTLLVNKQERNYSEETPLKIFISSVMSEFTKERVVISDSMKQLPITTPWLFEEAPASSEDNEDFYLGQVKECDIFVLLLGSSISPAVKREYEVAKEANKPLIVIIKSCEKDQPTKEFITSLKVKWAEFSNSSELSRLVEVSVASELIRGYRRYRLSASQVNTLITLLGVSDISNSDWMWPIKGQIVKFFGDINPDLPDGGSLGIGIVFKMGEPIVAARKGIVSVHDILPICSITHDGNWKTHYLNISPLILDGAKVSQNDIIGFSPKGYLFFSMTHYGVGVNPLKYLVNRWWS